MADKFVKSFNFGGEDNYFPLPIVTGEQNGMVLKVVDGVWAAVEMISVALINFTIAGTTYQAESGMTWEAFINSNYNDGSFTLETSGDSESWVIYTTETAEYYVYEEYLVTAALAKNPIIGGYTYALEDINPPDFV